MKICTKCRRVLQSSEFRKASKNKSGLDSICKECNKTNAKIYYQNNKGSHKNKLMELRAIKKAYVADIKSKSQCYKCGEKHPACLDFHHINQDDKIDKVCMLAHHNYSIKKIQEEIDKCIVLCSNCHRKLHFE